jgi:hypothetical protein
MDAFPDRINTLETLAEYGRNLAMSYSLERQERSVVDAWNTVLRLQIHKTAGGTAWHLSSPTDTR